MKSQGLAIAAAAVFVFAGNPIPVPHCDTMDGPVVRAAQEALESGNVNRVLIWVQKQDEAEIRRAFDATLLVRGNSQKAKELADHYFFETVVRVHRVGEGASFTGLKPAGGEVAPVIPAADKAVADGAAEPLVKLVHEAVERGLREHLKEVLDKRGYRPDDVSAGREYVQSYVEFIHYAERLYDDAVTSGHARSAESRESHE